VNFIIETPRLALREWTDGDVAALFAITSDADVMRYIRDGKPITDVGRVRDWLDILTACYREHGYGRWAVVEKDGGRVVGSYGFWPMAGEGEIDFGYMLARDCWGRGYATEAGRAALRHGFEQLGFTEVTAKVVPENAPSCRVLEKLGFEYRGLRTYGGDYPGELASYILKREDHDARAGGASSRAFKSDAGQV
jgi:RimJ/RimL family protein N-acetyltransferase